MSRMFCLSGFNHPIGGWDVSRVTNMSEMFKNATYFNQPLGKWNVSNITNTNNMFQGASQFNQSHHLNGSGGMDLVRRLKHKK